MESWERLELIMKMEGLNKNSFSAAIGLSNNVTITRIINEHRSPSRATCEKIVKAFPKYNIDWLLAGIGEMIKKEPVNSVSVSESSIGDNNYLGYIGGNNMNVVAPNSGSVKIIKPDGTVETYTSNHSLQELLDLKEQLRATMVELESKKREISSLEKIIEAKDETISILKNEHNKK